MDTVKVISVIICTKTRILTEIFDLKENLIAEHDPVGEITPESLFDFLKYHYPNEEHETKIRAYYLEN